MASEPGAKWIGGVKEIEAPTYTIQSLLIIHTMPNSLVCRLLYHDIVVLYHDTL